MNQKIDIRLERDPRYAAAKTRLYELMAELSAIEKARNDADAGISSLIANHTDKLQQEAFALLSGAPAPTRAQLERETLAKTLDELTHRLAVLRQAVTMQRQIIGEIRAEVGKAIAFDLLPQHKANVAAVVKALIQLNAAAEIQRDLCERLFQNDVPFSAYIRPMQVPGLGLLSDKFSRASMFVLEAYEHDFIALSDVPDNLKEWARAKKPNPVRAVSAPIAANVDGWVDA